MDMAMRGPAAPDVRLTVFAALDNAVQNGYTEWMSVLTPFEIAEDLVEKDADLERYTPEYIESHVRAWQALQR